MCAFARLHISGAEHQETALLPLHCSVKAAASRGGTTAMAYLGVQK